LIQANFGLAPAFKVTLTNLYMKVLSRLVSASDVKLRVEIEAVPIVNDIANLMFLSQRKNAEIGDTPPAQTAL
jgi:hypothetical protein